MSLLNNVRLNKFSNVLVLDIALADFNGKGRLFIATGTSHSLISAHSQAHGGVRAFVELECKTLDKLVSELNIPKIDLLNLDVEGSAYLVLRGARESLKTKLLRRVIIEIHNREEAIRCLHELLNNDYRVFCADGFVMALAKKVIKL
ncbi:MAG: FkbM family methyltransferase [Candidatus Odinarchaeia archaeon]